MREKSLLGGGRGKKLATSHPFSWVTVCSPEAGTSGKPANLVIYMSALPILQHLNQKAMASCTNKEVEGLAEWLSSKNISSPKKSTGHRKPLSWDSFLRASINISNTQYLLIMWYCNCVMFKLWDAYKAASPLNYPRLLNLCECYLLWLYWKNPNFLQPALKYKGHIFFHYRI